MHKFRFLIPFVIFAAGFALSMAIDNRRVLSSVQGTLSNTTAAQTTQKPPIYYWDYRVVAECDGTGKLNKELDALGSQGFEIYSATHKTPRNGNYYCVVVVLRRPK
jgi:hypothetical protein